MDANLLTGQGWRVYERVTIVVLPEFEELDVLSDLVSVFVTILSQPFHAMVHLLHLDYSVYEWQVLESISTMRPDCHCDFGAMLFADRFDERCVEETIAESVG